MYCSNWKEKAELHRAELWRWLEPQLKRREFGKRHPVYDFMFDYYSFKPSYLVTWSPGVNVLLDGALQSDFSNFPEFETCNDGLFIPAAKIPPKRVEFLSWAIKFLEKTSQNAPRYNCFGLHEWAMVYRTDSIRHNKVPLRLSAEETNKVVESLPLCCSHIDAFRFFTNDAMLLNKFTPTRAEQINLDQPACIHVNMDLYKFAYKLYPWISSEIIRKAFFLAIEAREIDMRASPYDFREWGFDPIKIETTEGRKQYAFIQNKIAEKASVIRKNIILEFNRVKCATSQNSLQSFSTQQL